MPDEDKNRLTSIILPTAAVIISIIALIFSGLQWLASRDQLLLSQGQLLLSVKPSLNFDLDYDPDDLPAGLKIDDAGPGPAVVQSVTYFVDRKMIGHDTDAVLNFANLSDAANITTLDLEKGDTLAVGENDWLLKYKSKPKGKQQQEELQQFSDLIEHHLAVEIQFCSILEGHCDKKCSTDGWCE